MRWLAFAMGGLTLAAVPACTEETPAPAQHADLAPIVRRELHVVEGEAGIDFEIAETTISGPPAGVADLASRAPGDVLVARSGGGLLRRVLAVRTEGDRIILDTEQATLEDVFEQAHVRGSLGDGVVNGAPAHGPPGLGARGLKLEMPALSLHDRRIPMGDGNEIEILDAEFDLKPQLDLDLVVQHGAVQRLKVVAGGEAHTHAHFRYHLKKTVAENGGPYVQLQPGDDGMTLAETPRYYAVFWAGWVPIVASVRARLIADWNVRVGGDVVGEQDFSADGAVSLGLEYDRGGWRNISSRSLHVDGHGDHTLVSHALAGELTLTARLDVLFYETAGPYVGLQGYAGVLEETDRRGTEWYAIEGLRGIAGAQAAIFGRRMAGYETVLFDANTRAPF